MNNNNYKRRKRKYLSITMFFILILLQLITIATTQHDLINSSIIERTQFTNDLYTGYISENVASVKTYDTSRQTSRSTKQTQSIYIRFITLYKPSIRVTLKNENQCSKFNTNHFNIELISDTSDPIFELDPNEPCYNLNKTECECPIKIRLINDSARDKLNREAQDSYKLQLKHESIQTTISIQILDDNDLEPMFDPSEYLIELNESSNKAAFTKIGRVIARDPDLSRNSLVRYYVNCNQNGDSSSSAEDKQSYSSQINNNCNKYFSVDWTNGAIFLKKSLNLIFEHLFENVNDLEHEIKIEIKAVDTGLKHNIANNLLLNNNHKYIHIKIINTLNVYVRTCIFMQRSIFSIR